MSYHTSGTLHPVVTLINLTELWIRNFRQKEKFPPAKKDPAVGEKGKNQKIKIREQEKEYYECIGRESNPGPVDGNDGFYH